MAEKEPSGFTIFCERSIGPSVFGKEFFGPDEKKENISRLFNENVKEWGRLK